MDRGLTARIIAFENGELGREESAVAVVACAVSAGRQGKTILFVCRSSRCSLSAARGTRRYLRLAGMDSDDGDTEGHVVAGSTVSA